MERYRAESPLQQAQRHLLEVEEHIAELSALIEEARADGHGREALERLLVSFEQTLSLAQQRVEIQRQAAATWRALALCRISK